MKRVLFIDRDGTLIKEPLDTEQVDSLDKLEFIPQVFQAMHLIATHLDFELVIVSNQDGLGTELFPEEDFWPVQNAMLTAFKMREWYLPISSSIQHFLMRMPRPANPISGC